MSHRSPKAPTAADGSNSRVQKITEKFETLITSQQQQPKQQVYTSSPPPHLPAIAAAAAATAVGQQQYQQLQSVQDWPSKGTGSARDNQPLVDEPAAVLRDLEARRGIKRSQAFRRSTSQTSSMNGGNVSRASNVQLIHSESIREALNKPLPEGPPPEKPPRTWGRGLDDGRCTLDGERTADSQQYEDVNMLIEVAFQEPGKNLHDSPSREQISLKQPVSEEHRKRLRRLSRCAELNHYTQQYGTIRLYDAVDKGGGTPVVAECKTADTKGLIEHYNKLSTVEQGKTPAPAPQTLYEYCIVVGYDLMQNKPYVKSRYPRHKQPHKMIEVFVYPDNGALVRNRNQEYCIILTDYPLRLYGFCRRVLPESSEFCIPLTYCLVTKYNEPKVFYKLLEYIESQHGNGRVPELLMEQFYEQKLPEAGDRLALTLPVSFEMRPALRQELPSLPTTMTINRPKDLRLEKTELYDIFKCLGSDGLIHVFESLLLEKMVILFSEHLSLLTSCVQGLLLILYPFQWQHILVTVIPEHLQQMLEAPVPMLAGTLQPVPEELWEGGNTCYVNLDKRTVRPARKEQFSILPSELKKPLRVSLDLVKIFEDSKGLASVLIGGAFVRFFVELFATLDPRTYEKASFLEQFDNPETKLFLNCFLETVMFADFLEHWHVAKLTPKSPAPAVGSSDYTLFNSKIAEKSQTKYWHSATFDEVVANSKHIERKGKTFMSKVKGLMKKS
ncbi:DENN domain-containing protein 2A-like [Anopheles stephensi]|uniref:DENN domain-containing protein 2A-like n=1 Tax=Anopheles stephensi TaxID=30069 RepID=UPI001658C386|nr:DENN domain-containing protein 2A-like [Anopheles stephensi]